MDLERYRELFIRESHEFLQSLNTSLLALERSPLDEQALAEVRRVLHTLKGAAATMGERWTVDVCHALEGLLDTAVKGRVTVTRDLMDLLFRSADHLERLTSGEDIGGEGPADGELDALLADVARAMEARPAPDWPGTHEPHHAAALAAARPITTLRIDVRRIDSLINLTGELLIVKSRLRTLGATLEAAPLRDTIEQLDRVSDSLQREVLQARMLPIGAVFDRFPRMIRDLAREAGKDVELRVSGGEIELDRLILDDVCEPLIHLLRNAVSHGLESPESRRAAGKPERGIIALSASRDADRVVLEVSDDGQGIDAERIRAAAVARGFAPAEHAGAMDEQELLALVFAPGFSTSDVVTDVSGRGVGLNVVKTRVEALKGSVAMTSAAGRGTRFILRFPPTLAIVDALLVRVGAETFAVPMVEVSEVLTISRAAVSPSGMLLVRGRAVPVLDLARLLALVSAGGSASAFALIAAYAGVTTGLVVDEVLGRQEIVIKPIQRFVRRSPGVSGATILGDGRVVLILDMHALLRSEGERRTLTRRG